MPTAKEADGLPLLQFRSAKVIHEPQGTFWTSVFALVGTMLGAGTLSLPSTMAQANVVPDVLLFLFMAAFNFVALHACSSVAEYTGKGSFESMGIALFGPWRQWFVRVLTLVLLFGIQAVFFVVSLDMLHPLVASYVSRFVLGAVLTALTIPLCLLETVYALRYTNAIIIASMLYIFAVVGVRAAMVGTWPTTVTDVTSTSAKGLMYALPIQALSFGCQINSVRIYSELKDKSQMTGINAWSMVFGFILYVFFTFAGFVCFQGFPPADILTGFSTDDWLVNSIRIVLGPCVLLKIPLIFQPYMQALEGLMFATSAPTSASISLDPPRENKLRVAMTVVSLVGSFIMAIAFKDLSVIMGFVGGIGDLSINFAVPGLFMMEMGARTCNKWTKWVGIVLFTSGIAMAILSLIGLLA
ncbi:hypothetical protein H310_12451 [Aphanomyces invadans]|uniref:Amino acid transporter transmembrane domain-containing protein n=1 Tax=Aphanomyces invadans TaxID=157072 RepID=A0A024TI57_9STRA|nr:hypothetical protein H310_12451 [Aphanomyces invadans]ETV93684.1 hypothetical protein H310_12451 [Aphanomyces invadans]|eukprot:XP_008877725.1 hypothetical protein H310_12451 [Aphanomyces invadans]